MFKWQQGLWQLGKSTSLWVFLVLIVYSILLYRSTLSDIPRSDHIVILSIFSHLNFPANLSQIAFLELLGQPRFQPLTWLLYFFQYKAFDHSFFLYHLTAVGLHALNGMLVFKILYVLSKKTLFSFLAAFLFVSFFTNLPIIAWPIGSYSLLSVSMSLLAILSLFKFYHSSRTAFLYTAYSLALVQLFLYEPNAIFPAFLLLFAVVLGWSAPNRKSLIIKNVVVVSIIYVIYGGLYLILMPTYAGLPLGVLNAYNIVRSSAAIPIELFNTVFGHNVFATAQVAIDELCFYVPFTARSFSLSTMQPLLVSINFLVYLALLALVLTWQRPEKGRLLLITLLIAWAVSYVFIIFLGRGVAYVLSQARHAYLPSLALIIVLAHFYERHFSTGWRFAEHKETSFLQRNGGVIVLLVCLFFIALNTAKTSWMLNDYMEYRYYPNAIYYEARDWLSDDANDNNRLFISIPTYPPHEKLAWGTDIIPDILLDDPRVTKNYQQATHILEWPGNQDAPTITELKPSQLDKSNDDFALTFGIMPHPRITEDHLEIFSSPAQPRSEQDARRWWLRLYFDHSNPISGGVAGIATIVLGNSHIDNGNVFERALFTSQPVPLEPVRMKHVVLIKENGTFGLIINGKLTEKVYTGKDEDLQGINLSPGALYRMAYRKPYYFAHTFLEFGRSSFIIQDKEVGHVFDNILFSPWGFQGYHLSLNY